jgi:hypothetical protein
VALLPVKTSVLRTKTRIGLMKGRLQGNINDIFIGGYGV